MGKKVTFVLALLLVSVQLLMAQGIKVSGVVVEKDTGEPVIGASVLVIGTSVGTITDLDGHFVIANVPSSAKNLRISYVGLKQKIVEITSNKMMVLMASDAENLGEVVVTAMGISREKKSLGYAVQSVKNDQLTRGASPSLSTALQGKLSGVEIAPSSGMPGASAKITIRGSRSFTGDNTPLYVVDGMPISSASDVSTLNSVTGSDFANRAIDIDPSDIESINVLKGQAASALYGMRASNGVVLITTKSGKNAKKGKPQVTFSTNFTTDVISSTPNLQTEFAQGTEGGYSPTESTSWGPKIADLANDPTYGGNVANSYTAGGLHQGQYYVTQRAAAGLDPWATPQVYDNVGDFFKNGSTWTNSLNVVQAFDKGNYSFSLGNSNSSGIVPSTGMERYNAKLSAQAQLNKNWSTGFSGSFISSHLNKQSGANNGVVATVYPAPASYDLAGIPSHIEGDPYTQNTYRSTGGFDDAYWAVENNKFTEDLQRFFGSAFAKYSTDFGTDNQKLDVKYQIGADSYTTNYTDLWGYGHSNGKGDVTHYGYSITELNSLLTANYSYKVSEDLNLNVLVGNEYVNKTTKYTEAQGLNFNFSGWNHINNASVFQADQSDTKYRTFGLFGNLALDYKNMLYFNVSGRNDIVSSMPHGNRSFFYPSVSLGFIFTELEALKNDILTFGKIRASYAQVGQAGTYVNSFYATPEYGGGFSSGTPITYPLNGVVAYTPYSVIYDPNLKPQNTNSYEVGADLSFFNGIISLNYTYSRQNVKDQIFEVPLAGSTGYSSLVTNGGSLHTDSHEFTLAVRPINTKDLKWDFAFNFTKTDNYVDKLAPGVNSIFLGGFVTPQVRAGINDKFPVIYGNSFKRNDAGQIIVDADGIPMVGEEKVIGSVSPDFRVGFNTSVEFHKFRFSAVLDWKQGGQMYSGTAGLLDYYGASQKSADYRKSTSFTFGRNSVKEAGLDAEGVMTYAPNDIAVDGSGAQNYFSKMNGIDESMIFDTSFIKLREISLSYPIIEKPFLHITASVFARNILVWTEFEGGLDPESSQGNTNMSGAFERFSLPGTSSYGLGFTVKF